MRLGMIMLVISIVMRRDGCLMTWVRLHTPPKVRGDAAKGKYYFNRSYERYIKTPDGEYISGITLEKGEIGSVSNFTFIATPEWKCRIYNKPE